MRAAWRLATNSLWQRRSRTLLLVASVSLCAALIAAVACAISSVNHNIDQRVRETVGAADLRVYRPGTDSFDAKALDTVDAWPETLLAVGRARETVALYNERTNDREAAIGFGIDPVREAKIRPLKILEGRLVAAEGEVTIDRRLAERLHAKLGDQLKVERFGDPITLTVVGICEPPALGAIFTKAPAYVTMKQVWAIAESTPRLAEIDVLLKPEVKAEAVAKLRGPSLPERLVLEPTSRITSGLAKNQQSAQIGFILAGAISFLAASFIIMTGLTTNVTERTRELAILRCIGGEKSVLAWAQLHIGLIVGGLGALVGMPIGVLGAWALIAIFKEQLPAGFQLSGLGVLVSFIGATASGLIGASWPAVIAARISPLQGLSTRSRRVKPAWFVACVVLGIIGPIAQLTIIQVFKHTQSLFWVYITIALPLMFSGYFVLGVPVMKMVTRLCAAPITRLLGLPPRLLRRTVDATPYRHGFTAAAMMIGLALMTGIWTNGRAILSDWVETLQFPDMFVYGLNMPEKTVERIKQVKGVDKVCAISTLNLGLTVERNGKQEAAFGIAGLTKYQTTFIAFDPETFFDMTRVQWVQGDEATAKAELAKGGAILVAREFLTARGIGAGDSVSLKYQGREHSFRVVGVVNAPGLDIASKFFSIGEDYLDQAVNSIFGTQADLRDKFGAGGVNLIQIGLKPGADHAEVYKQITALRGTGILDGGDAASIKTEIRKFVSGTLAVFAAVAIGALLVACFGVANLIVAGVQARQFEFGVLLAVGSSRGLLARLVLAEALLIAITACILGTGLGLQAAWGGQNITQVSVGIEIPFKPPLWPLVAGWGAVTVITILAALPTAVRLAQRKPRELIGAMQG